MFAKLGIQRRFQSVIVFLFTPDLSAISVIPIWFRFISSKSLITRGWVFFGILRRRKILKAG